MKFLLRAWTLAGLIGISLSQLTCSSSRPVEEGKLQVQLSERRGSVSEKWSRRMPGLVTDLSIAGGGERILVSLVPDPEGASSGRTLREPTLGYLNARGDFMWKKTLESRVKWHFLSRKADYVFATSMEGKLRAFDGKGKQLWEQDNYCRPYYLNTTSRLLCFRGDDAKPTGIGFEVYDLQGKKQGEYPVTTELVDWSVSQDERWILAALAGGKVHLIEAATLKLVQEYHLSVDSAAIAVSNGDEPMISSFYYRKGESGKHLATLAFFNRAGKLLDQVSIEGRFDQMAMSPSGKLAVLAGNNPYGQTVAAISREEDTKGGKFREMWRQRTPRYSDYSSPLTVMDDRILAGFEEMAPVEPGQSQAHLYAFDVAGKVDWSVPLIGEEGGYLFAYSRDKVSPTLVSVSDNGEMTAYELE